MCRAPYGSAWPDNIRLGMSVSPDTNLSQRRACED